MTTTVAAAITPAQMKFRGEHKISPLVVIVVFALCERTLGLLFIFRQAGRTKTIRKDFGNGLERRHGLAPAAANTIFATAKLLTAFFTGLHTL